MGGKLRVEAAHGVVTPELRAALAEHKPALVALLTGQSTVPDAPVPDTPVPVPCSDESTPAPPPSAAPAPQAPTIWQMTPAQLDDLARWRRQHCGGAGW